jgi:hypothetical protein
MDKKIYHKFNNVKLNKIKFNLITQFCNKKLVVALTISLKIFGNNESIS